MSDKMERSPELSPALCPRCKRPSYFRYISETETKRGSPICWGASERDCPGWEMTPQEDATQFNRDPLKDLSP